MGVTIVREREDMGRAVQSALSGSPRDRRAVIAERFIEGREVTLGILAGRPLPVVGLVPAREFYDYQAKYLDDRTGYEVPAKTDSRAAERVSEAGLAAFRALGCREYARVDVMLDKEGNPLVLEVNTIPGMTSHSLLPKAAEAVGLDFPTLVAVMAALAMERETNSNAGE